MKRGAILVSIAGVLAAGCATTATQAPKAPAPVANANNVNMCTILMPAELTSFGAQVDAVRHFNTTGVVGCRWQGKSYTLSLARDNSTLTGYQAHRNDPKYVNFADNTVNGRAGAHFSVNTTGMQCAQLIDGGTVSLSVSVALLRTVNSPQLEPCAEALRIARVVEPRLPRTPQ